GIVGVGAEQKTQSRLERGLLFDAKGGIIRRAESRGPLIENENALTVQPIGAPVRRDVGAVSPDRAHFLSADRLPDTLSVLDRRAVEQDGAGGGYNLGRNRGRAVNYFGAHTAEHREGSGNYDPECYPKLLVTHD